MRCSKVVGMKFSLNLISSFAFVGILGVATNLVVFTIVRELSDNSTIAGTCAFLLSVSQNYLLHGLITWRSTFKKVLSLKKYAGFFSGYSVSGSLMITITTVLPSRFDLDPYLSQVLAILCAATINFFVGHLVYKDRNEDVA